MCNKLCIMFVPRFLGVQKYFYTVRSNKKNRVGENGGLNQSKHQNTTTQVTRFLLFDRTLYKIINKTQHNVLLHKLYNY
jgi:hypothetical protein